MCSYVHLSVDKSFSIYINQINTIIRHDLERRWYLIESNKNIISYALSLIVLVFAFVRGVAIIHYNLILI